MNWITKMVIKLLDRRYKEMFTKIQSFLQGKKTYLAMVALIIEAVIEYSATGDLSVLVTKIIAAIYGIANKAGQARTEAKVDAVVPK